MLVLEALRAKFGDSLLLHSGTAKRPQLTVIDGGPPGVYNDALRPRLEAIRAERGLDARTPLDVELMMVSHIDDDHVAGMLELARKLNDRRESGQPLPWKIRRFWHNSFDDILDNDDLQVGGSGSAMNTASLDEFLKPEGSLILASVKQGRELRKLLDALGLGGNAPFKGLVLCSGPAKAVTVGDLKMTVVGPRKTELTALQAKWNTEIAPLLKKEKNKGRLAEIAAYVDDSVHNLSSIVVLVESQGKRILLTGDGRGDHTLDGLKAAKLLKKGKLAVDVLKVPHHGSSRNVEKGYFETIVAKHYVVSADGKHDNPDLETLEMISAARPDDGFTIYLTYPLDKFSVAKIGQKVKKFFAAERDAGRRYKVVTREAKQLSVPIKLA
jgi:glyoxylase-like metal-dependent hydrolase (beta-lactamase superfamily II)